MKAHDLRGRGLEPPEGKWDPAKSPRGWPWKVPGGRYDGAIMAHQLGCVLGTSARQRAAVGGDRELARVERCLRLPYHAVGLCATGEPRIVGTWRPEIYTWHGGPANAWTAGLGIEGRYPLAESGRLSRHTAPPGSAARAALEVAAPSALRALAEVMPAGRICLITHRQTSSDRGADPGELVIRLLAPQARALGIVAEPDLVLGGGQPWPASWRRAWVAAGGEIG